MLVSLSIGRAALRLSRESHRHPVVPCFVNANKVMKHLTAFRCQVVKLFAKHLKIEEQKVMLRKGCFPLAVRTNLLFKPKPPASNCWRCLY